jgi:hypothetical protein
MNPNFPVTTYAVWSQRPTEIEQVISTKVLEMTNNGKTDNIPRIQRGTDPDSVSNVYRDWIDEAAANEWISFNNQIADPRLLSIAIATS